MMISGTLYALPGTYRCQKIQIAAAYSGAHVELAPDFVLGQTNKTDVFLKKFPMGKVPAFEDHSAGVCLIGPNAIAHYVSNDSLRGKNPADQALIMQYLEFAETEIIPSACIWVYPIIGFKPYNKQDIEKAQDRLKKCFAVLNDFLQSRTFLIGERISLADIVLACNMLMLYTHVLDPIFREPYKNLNRWFLTCINQPQFKVVLGDVKLCKKPAIFDSSKYKELHPKKKKTLAEKIKEKRERKLNESQTEKPVSKDIFSKVPDSSFDMDNWKKVYSNNASDKFNTYLWKHFDPKAWSWWHCEYRFNHEHKVDFKTANSVTDMFQRLQGCREHLFGVMLIFDEPSKNPKTGKADGKFTVSGVWLLRGNELIFTLGESHGWNKDASKYKFRKLDPLNKTLDKSCVESYLDWEFNGEYRRDYAVEDGMSFK